MSLLDSIHGIIARRVLLNYRLDPAALRKILPTPFRPKLYRGVGIGGVCMIRFRQLRPRMMPAWVGLSSENAAHRIAVEWEQDGVPHEGVYIPQRNTNSWFNATFGGRVFPGIFVRSRFDTEEAGASVRVRIVDDGGEQLAFAGRVASSLPASSVFPTLDEAAGFFSLGATGYSATRRPGHYHGMELRSLNWALEPLTIEDARSRFYEDTSLFPRGAAEVDCALLMRDIDHEWHSRPDLFSLPDCVALTVRR
ncbi:DUF2071 domain-containing protein [Nannocystis pusilla]|uniref:DUF2071 domain-containing protein n=1 Tax=Nannocystis pusilla TaxID=889268 RepID=UPI003BF0B3F8